MVKNPSAAAKVILVLLLTIATFGRAQTVTPIFSFHGPDGGYGASPLVQGRDGNLYGTTTELGTFDFGTVFEITTSGQHTVVHNFTGGEGYFPSALLLGTNGKFYGAAAGGGSSQQGAIFTFGTAGIVSDLHGFTGTEGYGPVGPLVQGTDGNLYGVAQLGGTANLGTVFKVSTSSGALTKLHDFNTSDGSYPTGLIQGVDGNFYGLTNAGGSFSLGTVFRITSSGVFTTLHHFTGGNDGSSPTGTLTQGSDGTLYGTTSLGGNTPCACGTIFKITANGTFGLLHKFVGLALHNTNWNEGPYLAANGLLYGTAVSISAPSTNQLYRVATDGSGYSVLYQFTTAATGWGPFTTPVQHTNGKFYGSNQFGGDFFYGNVYSVDDGMQPFVRLVQSAGKVGQTVTILGGGLSGSSSVCFTKGTGGCPSATFTVGADTYITATVPSGAITGPVTVTAPGGTLTSNTSFRIIK